MIFNYAESRAILAIHDAAQGDTIHPDAATFTAGTLSRASGQHPHVVGDLLDRLGIFALGYGYRRSTAQLRAVIAEHLEDAANQLEAHIEALKAEGVKVDPAPSEPDVTGTVRLGDWEFAP